MLIDIDESAILDYMFRQYVLDHDIDINSETDKFTAIASYVMHVQMQLIDIQDLKIEEVQI